LVNDGGRTEKLLASICWYDGGTFSRRKLVASLSVRFGCMVSSETSDVLEWLSGRK
jgi:hypothetical protein